jgi:hypothetical protein
MNGNLPHFLMSSSERHRLEVKSQAAQKVKNQTFQPSRLLLVADKQALSAFLALFKF